MVRGTGETEAWTGRGLAVQHGKSDAIHCGQATLDLVPRRQKGHGCP